MRHNCKGEGSITIKPFFPAGFCEQNSLVSIIIVVENAKPWQAGFHFRRRKLDSNR